MTVALGVTSVIGSGLAYGSCTRAPLWPLPPSLATDSRVVSVALRVKVNQLLAAEPDEPELWKVLKSRKCGSAPGGDGKVVDFYRAMCAPLEGGSGRGLTKLLAEVVQHINLEDQWFFFLESIFTD